MSEIISKEPTGKVQIERTTGQKWLQYHVVEWVWSPCLQQYCKQSGFWWEVVFPDGG